MNKKSHPFSIYLLKKNIIADDALATDHKLLEANHADRLPVGAKLYILNGERRRPWWTEFFGVRGELWQQFKGAILLLPVDDRWFALSFGPAAYQINDGSYEYDFGLRVTLNSLDPQELKSADVVEPGSSRRRRTQVPISADLTFLDFDGNSQIIKSLTGKVRQQYRSIFNTATGSSFLKIGMKSNPDELTDKCRTLLELYESDDYKRIFPHIENILPVKDPNKIAQLDDFLLSAIRTRDEKVILTIPELIDYRDKACCRFKGPRGLSDIYSDISIEAFFEYLGDLDPTQLTLADLKDYRMLLTDVDGQSSGSFSIYRSLVFDTSATTEGSIYHFNEGSWYKAQESFVLRLRDYIDERCVESDLPAYDHDAVKDGNAVYSEGRYNSEVARLDDRFVCLDQTDVSPSNSTKIEPCDLYRVEDIGPQRKAQALFYHIKISTRSSALSHLFNQGMNSIEIIKQDESSRQKLLELIQRLSLPNQEIDRYTSPIASNDFRVIFGIITRRDSTLKSRNLPLFSQISLMRIMQRLGSMEVNTSLMFIRDDSPKKGSHKRPIHRS